MLPKAIKTKTVFFTFIMLLLIILLLLIVNVSSFLFNHLKFRSNKIPYTLFLRDDSLIDDDVEINQNQNQNSNNNEEYFDIEADNALIERIEAEVLAESGVTLDQLINPSKVVNLERELVQLEKIIELGNLNASEITEIELNMEDKRKKLAIEKRAVMTGWLKNLFVGQSILAGMASLAMVYDAVPGQHLDLSIQVLGFWMWWLFIVPSLRARKPKEEEKEALNIAFLATPLVSVAMPIITKDIPTIWWANGGAVALSYAYAYLKPESEGISNEEESFKLPPILVKAWKALDYGSGQERGARK